jgi:hypothetical protein
MEYTDKALLSSGSTAKMVSPAAFSSSSSPAETGLPSISTKTLRNTFTS